MTSAAVASITTMRVAVVDVGSNTVRLLVAARRGSTLEPLYEDKAYLRLGDDVERLGWVSEEKLCETLRTVRGYSEAAAGFGVHQLEIVVTAPGRRAANADELVKALNDAAGARVRVLTAEDEALLAFVGALSSVDEIPDTVAVCDSGGGSTEVAVGTPLGPSYARSIDVGSLTVRRVLPDDPPGKPAVAEAREFVSEQLSNMTAPLPKGAFATGGTARALRRLVGKTLGEEELTRALRILAKRPSADVAREFGLDPERAWTLVGGAVILAELQQRLSVPLVVSRTGMREGVALTALAEAAAA
jgi:exopolyphosphatase/guanosine-5'-triphosphate,3'-diphosphate pyrophosphatase